MIATYKPGAMDSGGAGICNTPPTALAPPGFGAGKYFVGGFTPVLERISFDLVKPIP